VSNTRCIFYLYSTANSAGHACTATSIKFFSEHEKGENEKTKRNSCPDSDLTYPYTQYSSTASELHYSFRSPQSRLNYRQTKNPHESTTFQRRRRDPSHRKYTGGGRSTRPDQTQLPARFAPSFLFSFFFSFFFFFFASKTREEEKNTPRTPTN